MRKILGIMAVASLAFSLAAFAGDKLSTQELLDNLKNPDAWQERKAAEEFGDRGEKLGSRHLFKQLLIKKKKFRWLQLLHLGKSMIHASCFAE